MSLFLLFLGILMTTVPLDMQNLSSYIISSNHLDHSPIKQQTLTSLLSHTFVTDVGRLLLGISSFLLLPSTLGYLGAVRESRLLLILVRKGLKSYSLLINLLIKYFTPIILLWGLELVFLILLPAFKTILSSTVSWVGRLSLTYYRGDLNEINLVTFAWNNVMAQLECCGVHNYTDFTHSKGWQMTKLNLQASKHNYTDFTYSMGLVDDKAKHAGK